MILFLSDGRLGNQLFQYAFLNTIAKDNEKIIVSGFEDLKEVFEIDNIIFLNKKNRLIRAFLFRICKPILNFFADKNIISSIAVNHEKVLDRYRRETTTFTKSEGFFNFFTFVKLGFFQSEKFFDKVVVQQLKIKDKYLDEANEFLKSVPQDSNKIFVHIRRGDYKEFTVYGKSTLLPISYFHSQIEWFMKNKTNTYFIFLSDEPDFLEKEFAYIKNKAIPINNSVGMDLAIMTKCNGAILSPSSFGWWGSYLMQKRDIVIAPKYWLGFNTGIDFGTCISNCPSFATQINIKNLND